MKQSDDESQHAPLSYRGAHRIVWLAFLLVIVWFVLRSLQSVVLLFAIVFLIAIVLNPIVVWLQKHRVPRVASVILLMVGLIAVAGTIILFAIPPLASQSQELVHNAPKVWQGIRTRIESVGQNYPAVRDALPRTDEIAGKVGAAAGTVGNILLRSTIGLVGGLVSTVFAVLLLIFVLANPQPLVAGYLALAPDRYREQAHRTLARLMRQMTCLGARRRHQRCHHRSFDRHIALADWRAAGAHVRCLRIPSVNSFLTSAHFSFPFQSCLLR